MSVTAVQAEKHLELLSAYGAVKDRLAESGLADSVEEGMRIVIDKLSSVLSMTQDDNDMDDLMSFRNELVVKYDKFEIDYAEVLAALIEVHEEGLSYTSRSSAKSLSDKSQNLVRSTTSLKEFLASISDRLKDVGKFDGMSQVINDTHSALDQSSQILEAMSSAAFQASVFADSLVEDSAA